MKKEQYLQGDVVKFCVWLSQCLLGQGIDFSIPGHDRAYATLYDALTAYAWPSRRSTGMTNRDGAPFEYPAVHTLVAWSNLEENQNVLNVIQQALRESFSSDPAQGQKLAGAVAATLHWGGVYRRTKHGGNKPWLAENHVALFTILQAVVNDHAKGEDFSVVESLRFNAGMTKVYSLLLNDFIIYDSRVAASLAWLALTWWTTSERKPQNELPKTLRFLCLPGNGKASGHRNPHPALFKTSAAQPYKHYQWNIRANWLLQCAQALAGERSQFKSLREIEAALFQMGDRVAGS
jgi:hypothetical protein